MDTNAVSTDSSTDSTDNIEVWNTDELCLYNKEKSKTILREKMRQLKEQNKIVIIKNLNRVDRKFIHKLAEKAEINSQTIQRLGYLADLELNSKEKFKPRVSAKAQARIDRQNKYHGECNMCSKTLIGEEALFNCHVWGAYCEECIEADEEMSCHKWEPL